MSSTRNKNSQHNYNLEYLQSNSICANRISPFRNYAYDNALPDAGILTGHMPGNAITKNYVDIETQLRGIGMSDLTKQREVFVPETYNRKNLAFFERPTMMLPEPLVVRKGERPVIP